MEPFNAKASIQSHISAHGQPPTAAMRSLSGPPMSKHAELADQGLVLMLLVTGEFF